MNLSNNIPLPFPFCFSETPKNYKDIFKLSVISNYLDKHFERISSFRPSSENDAFDKLVNSILNSQSPNEFNNSSKEAQLKKLQNILSNHFSVNDSFENVFNDIDHDLQKLLGDKHIFEQDKKIFLMMKKPEKISDFVLEKVFENVDENKGIIQDIIGTACREYTSNLESFHETLKGFNQELFFYVLNKYTHLVDYSDVLKSLQKIAKPSISDYSIFFAEIYCLLMNKDLSNNFLEVFDKEGQNIYIDSSSNSRTVYRVRFESSIKQVCNANDVILVLTTENKVYMIKKNGDVSLVYTGNEKIYFIYIVKNFLYIAHSRIINKHCLDKQKTTLALEVEGIDKMVFYSNDFFIRDDNKLCYKSESSIMCFGEINISEPLCLNFKNELLTILTKKEIVNYEISIELVYCHELSRYPLDSNDNYVSFDDNYYVKASYNRSFVEFTLLKRDELINLNAHDFGRDLIPQIPGLDELNESLRVIVNSMPLNFFTDMEKEKEKEKFVASLELLKFCRRILHLLLSTSVNVHIGTAIVHMCLLVIAGSLEFNDIDENVASLIREMISCIAKSSYSSKSSIVSIIAYVVAYGFEKLYRSHDMELVELIRKLENDKSKLQVLAKCFTLFMNSAAIVYLNKTFFDALPEGVKIIAKNDVLYSAIKELGKGNEIATNILIELMPSNVADLIVLFQLLFIYNGSRFISVFIDKCLNTIKKYISLSKQSNDNGYIPDDSTTYETRHPPYGKEDVNWEVSYPDAQAIEVIFSPLSNVLLGDHDFLKILSNDKVVYYRDMKTVGELPRSVLVNGNEATLSMRQYSGTNVYGLSVRFRKIKNMKVELEFNQTKFYTAYLLHVLSKNFDKVFSREEVANSIKSCDFLLSCSKLIAPPEKTKKCIDQTIIDTLYYENKAQIKPNEAEKEVEKWIITAVLNQLDLTNNVMKLKKKPVIKVTPPSTPKKSKKNAPERLSNKMLTPVKAKPQIIVPSISPLKKTLPLRASDPFSMKMLLPKIDHSLEEFISFMMKELYKLRNRLRYSEQKNHSSSNFATMIEKAKYFSTIRSVFDGNEITDLPDKKARCVNIIRLLSTQDKLQDIMSYTNAGINRVNSQLSVFSFISKLANDNESNEFLPYVIIPMFSFLANFENGNFNQKVVNAMQNLFKEVFSAENEESSKMLTSLAELNIFGESSERANDVVSEIMKLPESHMKKMHLLLYAISAGQNDPETIAKLFINNELIAEAFFVLSATCSKEINMNLLQTAAHNLLKQKPTCIQSILHFLGIYFNNNGLIQLVFNSEKIDYDTISLIELFLEEIGAHFLSHKISFLGINLPQESHDFVCGELISFLRTLLKGKAKSDLLSTFDRIIFNFQKEKNNENKVIGVFSVVGPSILPFSCGYARNIKTNQICKINNYCAGYNPEKMSVTLPNGKEAKVNAGNLMGSPRVPPSIDSYPPTKFRSDFLSCFILNSKTNTPLYATISLFLLYISTNESSVSMKWKELLKDIDQSIVDIATRSTNEEQYHRLCELAQGAATYITESKEVKEMIKKGPSFYIGNTATNRDFYCEIKYEPFIKQLGIITEYASNECFISTSIDLENRMFLSSTLCVKNMLDPLNIGDKVGIQVNAGKSFVTFFINNKRIGPEIPFEGELFTPFVISKFDFDISFGREVIENWPRCGFLEPIENVFEVDHYTDDFDSVLYDDIIFYSFKKAKLKDEVKNTLDFTLEKGSVSIRKYRITSNSYAPSVPFFGNVYRVVLSSSPLFGRIGKAVKFMKKQTRIEFVNAEEGTVEAHDIDNIFLEECRPVFIFEKNKKENIFAALSIRCLRVFCMMFGIHGKNSAALVKLLTPTLISCTGKKNHVFPFLLEYTQNVLSNDYHSFDRIINILCSETRCSYSVSSVATPDMRLVIDFSVKVLDSFGFTPEIVEGDGEPNNCSIRVSNSKKTVLLDSSEVDFDQYLEGDTISFYSSVYKRSFNLSVSMSPLFKYAADSDMMNIPYTIAFIHSFVYLIKSIKLDNEALTYVANALNKMYVRRLFLTVSYVFDEEFFKSFFKITSYTTILDHATKNRTLLKGLETDTEGEQMSVRSLFVEINKTRYLYNAPISMSPEEMMLAFNSSMLRDSFSNLEPSLMLYVLALLGNKNLLPIHILFKEWCCGNFFVLQLSSLEQQFRAEIAETNFPATVTVKTIDGSRLPDDCTVSVNDVLLKDITKEGDNMDAAVYTHQFPPGKLVLSVEARTTTIPEISVTVDTKKENLLTDIDVLKAFKKDLDYFLSSWDPSYDLLIAQSIDEEMCTSADKDKLNSLKKEIVTWRRHTILSFNKLIESKLKLIMSNSLYLTILRPVSHCISPDLKFRMIGKIISKNMNEKITLNFNRSAAALVTEAPTSSNAHSLFDQMINQVDVDSIPRLKSYNAPWVANLVGEGAIDAGGPGREIFTEMCEEMFLPFNHLFIQSPETREANHMSEFLPDPNCPRERMLYAGALVGLSFVTQSPQTFRFHPVVWSFLTGIDVTEEDVLKMDSTIAKLVNSSGMKKLVAYSVTGEEVKLYNTNHNEEVDEQTYRKVVLDFRVRELTSALKNLRSGFEIIMEKACRYILTPRQLKFFICGRDELSAEQLISRLNFIEGESYAKSFKWVVEQLTSEERILLLKFATGRVSIPVAGSGASLTLNVSFNKPCGKNPPYSLPVAATCSSTIDVPCYPTKEIMLERIRVAIHFGSDMTLDTDMQVSRRVFE